MESFLFINLILIDLNSLYRFQYVLAAATSIATKVNEESLTYLNQGQPYEIKMKKLGDLSNFRGKLLRVSRNTVDLFGGVRRLISCSFSSWLIRAW